MTRRQDFEHAIKPYLKQHSQNRRVLQQLYSSATKRTTNFIRINVNGQQFVLPRSVCLKIPILNDLLADQKSSHMLIPDQEEMPSQLEFQTNRRFSNTSQVRFTDEDNQMMEISFEKNSTVFAAVVDYVQNDELHVPQEVCPRLFARDLRFWGFDINELEPCCFAGVVHFLYEQDKLNKFHGFLQKNVANWDHRRRYKSSSSEHGEDDNSFQSLRKTIWTVVDEPFASMASKIYFSFMCTCIILSFLISAMETHDHFIPSANITDAETLARILQLFNYMDWIISVQQLTDYTLRLLCYPRLLHFLLDPINLTDGLACASLIVRVVKEWSGNRGFALNVEIVSTLQLLRILRMLRPLSKLTGFRLIYFTLRCSIRELMLVFMLLLFLTMVFSALLYYLGDKTSIPSIPEGMWFSLTTMTTVGYGDIVPDEWRTMTIGSVLAVFGVIMMSMTTPIMVSNFHSLYINAVVGQPSTIKNLHKKLEDNVQLSTDSSNSLGYPLVQSTFIPPWKRLSFNLVPSQDEAPAGDDGQSVPSKNCSFWCKCTRCRRKAKVQVSSESFSRTLIEKVPSFTVTRPSRISPMFRESSLSETSAQTTSETDTDKESSAGDGEWDEQTTALLEHNRALIMPRHRNWYANYESSSTESDSSFEATHKPHLLSQMKKGKCLTSAPVSVRPPVQTDVINLPKAVLADKSPSGNFQSSFRPKRLRKVSKKPDKREQQPFSAHSREQISLEAPTEVPQTLKSSICRRRKVASGSKKIVKISSKVRKAEISDSSVTKSQSQTL